MGGGPIQVIKEFAASVGELSAETEILTLDDPKAPWISASHVRIHAIGPAYFGGFCFAPQLVSWLRRHAMEYDAVILNGLWNFTGLATFLALWKRPIPYFVFVHGMLSPWFKTTFPLKHLKKLLYWKAFEHHVLRNAKGVMFSCEEERRLAHRAFTPYDCHEVVVKFGISAPNQDAAYLREAFFAQHPMLRDKTFLLFLGRLHPVKGCDILIEAFSKVASNFEDLRLVLAGPDQRGWRAELEALAFRLGVGERVVWAGMLQGDQKWGAIQAADALVLPSHQENFGMVVAEALSCGLPVLISNKVNIWHEIELEQAGLVRNDDYDGTVRSLEEWLSFPPEAKDAFRTRALVCFNKHFERRQAAKSFLAALAPVEGEFRCESR